MPSHMQPRRTLHVVRGSPNEEVRIHPAGTRSTIWLGVVVFALLGSLGIGLVAGKRSTDLTERPSPEQQRIDALSEQLSRLAQTDLIVFPDGHIWYVRSVRGKNLEIVGWIGANTRSEYIDSFVLREDHVMSRLFTTMTRHGRSNGIDS